MKPLFLSVCALVASASASIAEDANANKDDFKTELAAATRKELANFASNILAASICKGAKFNSDGAVSLMLGARLALSKDEAQSSFFDAMKSSLSAIHDRGESSWCEETLKAAKDRHSEMLTEEEPPENGK